MENTSKALIMAAGVLIGILILSLIAFSYRQLVELARLDHEKTVVEQQTNYNAQWEKYNGTIYGTDVMSMANQIIDYNATQAANEGYARITAVVTIKNKIETTSLDNSTAIKVYVSKDDMEIKNVDYDIDSFYERMETIRKGIEQMKKQASYDFGGGNKVKISKLSNMRRDDIINTYDIETDEYSELQKEIDAYKEVLNLYQEIKAKRFTSELEYDNKTGRIVNIIVKEK